MQVLSAMEISAVGGGMDLLDTSGGGGFWGSFSAGANGVLDAAGRGSLVGGMVGSLIGPEGTALGAAAGAVIGAGVKILTSPGKP